MRANPAVEIALGTCVLVVLSLLAPAEPVEWPWGLDAKLVTPSQQARAGTVPWSQVEALLLEIKARTALVEWESAQLDARFLLTGRHETSPPSAKEVAFYRARIAEMRRLFRTALEPVTDELRRTRLEDSLEQGREEDLELDRRLRRLERQLKGAEDRDPRD